MNSEFGEFRVSWICMRRSRGEIGICMRRYTKEAKLGDISGENWLKLTQLSWLHSYSRRLSARKARFAQKIPTLSMIFTYTIGRKFFYFLWGRRRRRRQRRRRQIINIPKCKWTFAIGTKWVHATLFNIFIYKPLYWLIFVQLIDFYGLELSISLSGMILS